MFLTSVTAIYDICTGVRSFLENNICSQNIWTIPNKRSLLSMHILPINPNKISDKSDTLIMIQINISIQYVLDHTGKIS